MVLSLLLFTSAVAGAEVGSAPLSLADALARGRGGAPETAAALARERAAEARVRQAKGYRMPQVRLSEQWIHTNSPADVFGLLLSQQRFSFADFVAGDPNEPSTLETAITRLEVEVPIWTGGELAARAEQARLAAEAAAHASSGAGDQAALAAAEAWINLALAREAVVVLEKSRETVAAHVTIARDYSEQGMLVRSELLRAEVELAHLDDLLAEARGNARLAAANLAFRLGEPIDPEYPLAPLGEPPALGPAAGSELAVWIAGVATRHDLLGARSRVSAGELEAKALSGGLWPRVGLVARHDRVDDQLFGSHGDSTTVIALASLSLFDGGTRRAGIAAARAEAEAGRIEVERFEEGIRLEVQQAYEAATVALERRATAAAALAAAEETVLIVEERFRAGLVKTTDLLDATTTRREGELRELSARAHAWLAQLQLAVAAGRAPESVLTAANSTSKGATS